VRTRRAAAAAATAQRQASDFLHLWGVATSFPQSSAQEDVRVTPRASGSLQCAARHAHSVAAAM
jgi:hypothetical protein